MLLAITLTLCSIMAIAQNERAVQRSLERMQADLAVYAILGPLDDDYRSLHDLPLTPRERKEILSTAKQFDENIVHGDSVETYYLIAEFQERIIDELLALLSERPPTEKEVEEYLKGLGVIRSDDDKLFNFTLFEKTGGTYRSYLSIMHHVDLPLAASPVHEGEYGNEDPYALFNPDGYHSIHTFSTSEGTKYLLLGFVRGCSYCFETSATLVRLYEGAFHEEFNYTVSSRHWEGGVSYDDTLKRIQVAYDTDDLTSYCSCIAEPEVMDWEGGSQAGWPEVTHHCECEFEFNGLTFELIRSCWYRVEE